MPKSLSKARSSSGLHPQSRALLGQIHRPRVIPYHLLDVESMRRDSAKLIFAGRPAAPPVEEVHDLVLHRDDGPPLSARYYRPAGAAAEAVLPVLLYFHGGGWTVGNVPSFDVLCRDLANGAGSAVVSVSYRLAPEHPFPAAVEDAFFALRWLAREAGALRLDAHRIAVGGDSAGGNLATVAALEARDASGPAVCAQVLVYPATDQRGVTPSHTTYGEGFMLTREVIAQFQSFYLPDAGARLDWRASPVLAPSLAGLPPTLMILAECDPLADDGEAYARRLQQAGVKVDMHVFPGMIHGFFPLGKFFDDAGCAVRLAAQWLIECLGQGQTR